MEPLHAPLPGRIYLHWVNGEPPCSRILAPAALAPPLAAALAGRATSAAAVEIQLPVLLQQGKAVRARWAGRLGWHSPAPGVLAALDPAADRPALDHAATLLTALTAPPPAGEPVPLTLAAPGGLYRTAAGAWHTAPGERSRGYRAVYSRVSVALQQTLRDALPPLALPAAASFDDSERALAILAWSVTPPHAGRHVDRFGWDVLDERGRARFLAAAARHLPARLRRLAPQLAGHPRAAAYSPARAAAWAASGSRLLWQLAEAEAGAIEALLRLAAEAPACRSARERTHGVRTRLAAAHSRLRRLAGPGPALAAADTLLVALLPVMARELEKEVAALPRRAA